MGDDRGLGEVLDSLAAQLGDHVAGDDPEQDRGGAAAGAAGSRRPRPGGFENLAHSVQAGRPVACTLAVAAQLLGASPQRVREAAQTVEPYLHNDGSPRWSLRGLEVALGLAPPRGRGSRRAAGTPWRGRSIRAG